jgi:hypothetical protein
LAVRESYICRSHYGQVVVFARCDQEVRIYLPDEVTENYLKVSLDEWAEIKKSYQERDDIRKYNDVVNAAWHSLGLRNPINKDNVQALKAELGSYFPRIWRGVYDSERFYCYNPIDARSIYGGVYVGATVAVSSIFEAVEGLFLFVEPAKENLSTFSHKIREALILACTEVESAWRSVLEANCATTKPSYSTTDYIRLVEPLRLKEWAVTLNAYPDLGSFSPFASWDETAPTKSLSWYQAYNAVKHHREEKFQLATFGSLISATAALHIMQVAQFGPEIYDRFFGNQPSPFYTLNHPVHDIADLYAPALCGEKEMSPKPYFG